MIHLQNSQMQHQDRVGTVVSLPVQLTALERLAFSDLKFVDRCEMASLTYSLLHMSRVVVVVVALAVAVAVAVS